MIEFLDTPSLSHSIDFEDTRIESLEFEDVYFNPKDPIAESGYVFIKGNNLESRFKQTQSSFHIVELGLGTGLNCYLTHRLWKKQKLDKGTLFYTSIEKKPFSPTQLKKMYSKWGFESNYSQMFLKNYPPPIEGFYQFEIPQYNSVITIIFGDVLEALRNQRQKVDCWFLDGFAPSKNSSMWNKDVFSELTHLSNHLATFATFTSVGEVKRNLREAGFDVKRIKGFGKKRHMLVGEFTRKKESFNDIPWMMWPQEKEFIDSVAIIGGGLSGSATAMELSKLGFSVSLFEKGLIADGASGNPAGIFEPVLSKGDSLIGSYYWHAFYLLLTELFPQIKELEENNIACFSGSFKKIEGSQIDFWKMKIEGLSRESSSWLNHWVNFFKGNDDIYSNGVFFNYGGWLNPKKLTQRRLEQCECKVFENSSIKLIQKIDKNIFEVIGNNNKNYGRFSSVVICNSMGAVKLLPNHFLELRPVRGQVSSLAKEYLKETQSNVYSEEKYLTPSINGKHYCGASYIVDDESTEIRVGEHDQHLNWLIKNKFLNKKPLFSEIDGRASIRSTSMDHFPIIGPVVDESQFTTIFHDLSKGKHWKNYCPVQNISGVYLNVGHGSRGITSSVLGAKVIGAHLKNRAFPIPLPLWYKINPSRFLYRKMKRGI